VRIDFISSFTFADFPKVQKVQSSTSLPTDTAVNTSSKTLQSSKSDVGHQKTSTPYNPNTSISLFTAKASKSPKLKSPKVSDKASKSPKLKSPNASDITTETKTPNGHIDLDSKENIVSPKKGKTPENTPKKTPIRKDKSSEKKKKMKTPETKVTVRKQSTPKDKPSSDLPEKRARQGTPQEKKKLSDVAPSPKKRRVQVDVEPDQVTEETGSNSSDVPDGVCPNSSDVPDGVSFYYLLEPMKYLASFFNLIIKFA
jgi:hypothetical protein